MLSKNSHIASLLALLISISLSLSTIHVHESMAHRDQSQVETGTNISADTTYCPICGYLFKMSSSSSMDSAGTLEAYEEILASDQSRYNSPSVFQENSRSPPFLA